MRPRAGSSSRYLSRMDSNEQRSSTCPSSTPSTSNGTPSLSRATRATSSGSTYRNSASWSRNRLISQGQPIRSTAAFFRVTNRIARPLQLLGDIPRPELDHVAARIGHIGGPAPSVAVGGMIVVEHLEAGRTQSLDRGLISRRRELHRVVDVHAAPSAAKTDLRPPQPDPGAISRHQPD